MSSKQPKKRKPPSLNPRQIRFIDAYMIDPSATKAARAANYTNPGKQGYRLLQKPLIKAEIQRRRDAEISAACLERQEKRERLARIARSTGEETKEKLRAIDLDNKMTGEYVEKSEVNVYMHGPLDQLIEKAAEQLRALGWTVEPPDA